MDAETIQDAHEQIDRQEWGSLQDGFDVMAGLIDWALETEPARRRQAIEGAKLIQALAVMIIGIVSLLS